MKLLSIVLLALYPFFSKLLRSNSGHTSDLCSGFMTIAIIVGALAMVFFTGLGVLIYFICR